MFKQPEVLSLGGVERRRGLLRELIEHVSAGGEGAGAMLHHASRQMVHCRDGLRSQACEHGVRAPVAESRNDIVVHTGTKQSQGSTRACALDREKVRGHSSGVLDLGSTEAEPVCELGVADEPPLSRGC